jgi:uncharacterized protein (TIGR02246 family)
MLCSGLLVLLICTGAPSDDKTPDKNAEAVGKAFASLAKAYNARDPKALAEMFTPNGEFIDADENVFEGRKAITSEFTVLFEINPKNSVEIVADDIREISPGVLSVDCEATMSIAEGKPAAGTKETAGAKETVMVDFVALLVKQADGRWLLASIRSEGERSLSTPHARLKQLEWLIGDWVDESDESTMQTNTRWSDDGHFILTDFTIHVAGRKVMSGTQRIGWDGSLDKFKSWVFDSEGGHAEGIWTRIDELWIVKATGVRPDGDACSATHTYQQNGPDAYLFSVTDRIVGNESAPDFTSHVVRKPPEPQTASAAAAAPRSK